MLKKFYAVKTRQIRKDIEFYGWKYKECSFKQNRGRPLTTDELICNDTNKNIKIYSDMVSTVISMQAVIEYLVKDNPFYANTPEERNKLTKKYLTRFKAELLELVNEKNNAKSAKEKLRSKLVIHFVENKEQLNDVLKNLQEGIKEK